jgi:homospermidine synthase
MLFQVVASLLGAIVWAIENPRSGIVCPDDLDFRRVLEIATPYLGRVVGEYTDWTPLHQRGTLFPEELDAESPWQFSNVRVM